MTGSITIPFWLYLIFCFLSGSAVTWWIKSFIRRSSGDDRG